MKDGDGFHGTVLKVSEGGNIGYVDVNDEIMFLYCIFFQSVFILNVI